jgi:hypothetical protein
MTQPSAPRRSLSIRMSEARMTTLLFRRSTKSRLRRLLSLPLQWPQLYVRLLDSIRPGYGTQLLRQQALGVTPAAIAAAAGRAGAAARPAYDDGANMKVLFSGRDAVYAILRACFDALGLRPRVAELGVLDGTNAARMQELLAPAALYLVDAWSTEAFADYRRANAHRDWVDDLDRYAEYFGGPLTEQSTFDRLHEAVVARFAGEPAVRIIRAPTAAGRDALRQELAAGAMLDLVYVDASHQYETVLDDLLMYAELLAPDGALQLNDCCHSEAGVRQNLGVLEAAVKFCKMSDFVPVLLTNSDWSDLVLVRRASRLRRVIDEVVAGSDIGYVEIPAQLLGAATVRSGRRANLSFC